MKIGIPRAGMYYRNGVLWESFFKALEIGYVLSPKTNKSMLERGSALMADESCLASKIYMGHVDWLLDRCDCLFIPWLSNFGEAGINCTRFRAFPAMTANLFRDKAPRILTYAVDYSGTQDMKHAGDEETAFLSMAKELGKSRKQVREAYRAARAAADRAFAEKIAQTEKRADGGGKKILLAGHDYCICDDYIGKPILQALQNCSVTAIDANLTDREKAQRDFLQLSDGTLPWIVSRELLGGIVHYKDRVNGIVLLTGFPCGPDSIVNEVIRREVPDLPILCLLLDGQDGMAGVETRIESFIDILNFREAGARSDG